MPDLELLPQTPRHIAAASVLALHAHADPEFSLELAERVLFAADRAGVRGHSDYAATEDEVRRAYNSLHRHGVSCTHDDVRAALNDAFVYGWGQ